MNRRLFLASATGLLVSNCGRQSPEAQPEITFEKEPARINVLAGGQPFTSFVHDPDYDKPFLYPLRTSSGRVISRGFPIEPREGDSDDHPWHRGIWYGHGDVNGQDFWREQGREVTGRLTLNSEPVCESRGTRGTIRVALALQPPTGAAIGSLEEEFTFEQQAGNFLIDAAITVLADQGVPLVFGDTDDGGFGMRLREEFRQDRGAVLINSGGLRDTENIWGKSAKWVDYSTTIDGEPAGVTMMDHPSNFRHPTTWHARGYGLCSANPFATRSFTGDPAADGSHRIPAGDKLEFRYRVVIRQGASLTAPDIDALHRSFSATS